MIIFHDPRCVEYSNPGHPERPERTGFKRVRLERFPGGHQVKKEEVERALRWFREVAKF